MIVEMCDVVRTLGHIDIDYEREARNPSSGTGDNSLDNIKRKIAAIEADRQRQIQKNQMLQTELFEKGIEIESLNCQLVELKEVESDRNKLWEETRGLRLACEAQSDEIASLKLSLATATVQESERGHDAPPDVDFAPPSAPGAILSSHSDDPDYAAMEVQLQDDGSAIVFANTFGGAPDADGKVLDDECPSADESSVSTCNSDSESDGECSQDEKMGDKTLKEEHSMLQTAYKNLEDKVSDLEKQLTRSNERVRTTKEKQELRERLLREVISQYKELQTEHEDTVARFSQVKRWIKMNSPGGNKVLDPIAQTASNANVTPILDQSPTFDSTGTSSTRALSDDATSDNSTYTRLSGVRIDFSNPNNIEEEFRRLEEVCCRLERDYELAISHIAQLEGDLAAATEQNTDADSLTRLRQAEVCELRLKYDQLQAQFQSATEKCTQLQSELDVAKLQAEEARKNQRLREQDLWMVIEQYKKLSEENEDTRIKMQNAEDRLGETEAKMATVNQELSLVKKKTKRHDLISENRKMLQCLEDRNTEIEVLEKNLRIAQSTAAKSKEDAKCVRKRLAASHYHFQQLQTRYNDILAQKTDMERNLNKAERHLKLMKTQQSTWTDKLDHIRGKRNEVARDNKKLQEENKELKTYCNDLLTLASKSIEAI